MPKPTANKQRSNKPAPTAPAPSPAKGRLDLLLTGLLVGVADVISPGLGQHVRPRIEELAKQHLTTEVIPDEMLEAARRAFFAHPGALKSGGKHV